MYKLKTSKAISKRFKVTSRNKLLRHMASRNHLLQKKSSKRKQDLRKVVKASKRDVSNIVYRLPYLF